MQKPASDAIKTEIEHREGVAIGVMLPYTKKRFGKGVSYGELIAMAGERHIWRSS